MENSIKNYILLVRMCKTTYNKVVYYRKKFNNPYISNKERKELKKLIDIKINRYENLRKKMKNMSVQLDLSSHKIMCLNDYGMLSKDVDKYKGKNKKEWGNDLRILHIVFMKSCY